MHSQRNINQIRCGRLWGVGVLVAVDDEANVSIFRLDNLRLAPVQVRYMHNQCRFSSRCAFHLADRAKPAIVTPCSNRRSDCPDNSTWSLALPDLVCPRPVDEAPRCARPRFFSTTRDPSTTDRPISEANAPSDDSCLGKYSFLAAGSNSHRVVCFMACVGWWDERYSRVSQVSMFLLPINTAQSLWKADEALFHDLHSNRGPVSGMCAMSDSAGESESSRVRAILEHDLDDSKLDLRGPHNNVPAVDITSDGALLAAASIDKSLSIFDLQTGSLLLRQELANSWFETCVVSAIRACLYPCLHIYTRSVASTRGWAVRFLPSACVHECADSLVDADSESGSGSDQSEASDDAGAESDDMEGPDSEQDAGSERVEDSEHDEESDASTDSESSDGSSYHDLVGGEQGEVAAITAPESSIVAEISGSDVAARDDLVLYATQSDLFLVRVTTFKRVSTVPSEASEPANAPAPRVNIEHRIRGVCDGTLTVYRALHRLCHVEVIPQLGVVLVASSASDQVTMLVVTRYVPLLLVLVLGDSVLRLRIDCVLFVRVPCIGSDLQIGCARLSSRQASGWGVSCRKAPHSNQGSICLLDFPARHSRAQYICSQCTAALSRTCRVS